MTATSSVDAIQLNDIEFVPVAAATRSVGVLGAVESDPLPPLPKLLQLESDSATITRITTTAVIDFIIYAPNMILSFAGRAERMRNPTSFALFIPYLTIKNNIPASIPIIVIDTLLNIAMECRVRPGNRRLH